LERIPSIPRHRISDGARVPPQRILPFCSDNTLPFREYEGKGAPRRARRRSHAVAHFVLDLVNCEVHDRIIKVDALSASGWTKVGAPVKVRGVQIGSVAEIELGLPPSEGSLRSNAGELRLPVIIEIDRSQIVGKGGTGTALQEKGFDSMIKRGMRAQLNVESLLEL
jgi:MlaD protein